MEPFHHSALIVHSLPALIPLWHLLPVQLQWTCFEKRGQLVIQTVKWMSSPARSAPHPRIQKIKYAINLFWSDWSFGLSEVSDIKRENTASFCSASISLGYFNEDHSAETTWQNTSINFISIFNDSQRDFQVLVAPSVGPLLSPAILISMQKPNVNWQHTKLLIKQDKIRWKSTLICTK